MPKPAASTTPISPAAALDATPGVRALAEALAAGGRAVATGIAGSSTAFVAAVVAHRIGRPVLLVVAHTDEADEAEDELAAAPAPFGGPGVCRRFPALEVAPGESVPTIELFAERLSLLRALLAGDTPRVLAAPMAALMQTLPAPDTLDRLARTVRRGERVNPAALLDWLDRAGYARVDAIEEPGHFAQRGGILDIFPPATGPRAVPVRLDFFGDEIDRIEEIDLDTMGSDRAVEAAELVAVRPELLAPSDKGLLLPDLLARALPGGFAVLLAETMEIVEQGRGYYERVTESAGIVGPPKVLAALSQRARGFAEINQFSAGATDAQARVELPVAGLPPFERDAAKAFGELAQLAESARVLLCCQNEAEAHRAGELAREHAAGAGIDIQTAYVHRGFFIETGEAANDRLAVVPYHELLHRFDARRRTGRLRAGRAMDTFLDFAPGDFVVHAEHGIARFSGLTVLRPGSRTKKTDEAAPDAEEFLTLEFAGKSSLHVPCAQIDLVQKYVGGFAGKPPLSSLGGTKWKNQKARVAESVRDLAGELLRVRAAREHMPGIQYPADTPWQGEFEAEFPYQETEDQLAALVEIKKDMTSPRPMDRLLCGDVGFGKTELAIRAAFKACEFGKQVAVLVPTTVLAEQHERTFRARFADYPFRVESLSRFKTTKEVNDTLRDLRKGQVDVVIGTHRLLSKDVKFADLGLVVIDEEQRFGVEHKDALLQLRLTVDVLTLSATPIPRTLHMAMLGLRDISSLTTPPADRRAIVTEVIPHNPRRIQQAIERELARDGQVFFVHNRVHDIQSVADDVRRLVPSARIVYGHGQMQPKELEEVMLRFMRRDADVLVSTTIIESGIDIPTANTMIINDADRFGLAELHQLRGRVGRYKHRAYCYLLLNPDRAPKEVAQKRLKALEQYSMLGAGFKIAMRDLEIRGAGNLLGPEQSGHIAAVGYDMYCRLLDSAVHELADPTGPERVEHLSVDLGVAGLIPKPYIPSDARRLEAYRRIAAAASAAELEKVEADLTSAYGPPPAAAQRLLAIAAVRVAARTLGVRAVARRGPDIVFMATDPAPVAERLAAAQGSVRTVAAGLAQTNLRSAAGRPLAEVYWRPPAVYLESDSLLRVLPARLAGRGPSTPPSPATPARPAGPTNTAGPRRRG
jgi:transcription-repair coupling factor (superfamily II helicase)